VHFAAAELVSSADERLGPANVLGFAEELDVDDEAQGCAAEMDLANEFSSPDKSMEMVGAEEEYRLLPAEDEEEPRLAEDLRLAEEAEEDLAEELDVARGVGNGVV